MALTIKLPPEDKKEEYSLYVNCKIKTINKDNILGTLITCEGCGVAFYSATNSRRAIIFCELSEPDFGIPLLEGRIPYFKQNIRILYKARGRRIELLKFMCHNLEKKYGTKIYELGLPYWLMLGSFIDSYSPKKNKSGKPVSNKRQLYMLTEKYIRIKESKK